MPETLKVYKHYMSISPLENGYELKLTKPIYPRGEHEKYYHSRIVEALKAENDELKAWKKGAEHAKTELDLERIRLQDIIRDLEAKLGGLLDIIDKQHTASLYLCDKLDKAKDVLEQISRMSPLPDHKSNTMTLVACREIASVALGNKSIVHALRKHKAMNSIYPDAPEQR